MTTETAVVEKVFDVPAETKRLDEMKARHAAILPEIVTAGQNGDVGEMTKLGAELAKLAVDIDKLEKRINRAVNGVSIPAQEKITARENAFNALRGLLNTPEASPVYAFKSINPTLQQIRIEWDENGNLEFSSVGGIRQVTKTGIKRPRANWTNDAHKDGLGTKEVIELYGKKHGQTKNYGDMTSQERQALLNVIVSAESFKNTSKTE